MAKKEEAKEEVLETTPVEEVVETPAEEKAEEATEAPVEEKAEEKTEA